jgi:hypothetical protein
MNSACLAIEENSEDLSTEFATVYLMAQGGSNSNFRRTRTLNAAGGVDLFQGRGEGEDTYKGDRKVLHPSRVSIQIHVLDIFSSKGRDGDPERRSVPAIAVHLPKNVHEWAKNILKQP